MYKNWGLSNPNLSKYYFQINPNKMALHCKSGRGRQSVSNLETCTGRRYSTIQPGAYNAELEIRSFFQHAKSNTQMKRKY